MFEFIQKYFIDPIYQHSGYNTANTIVYGLLLGVGIIGSERYLAKKEIKVDEKFLMATAPFVILAAIVRSLVDAEIFPTSFFLITPGIFLSILLLVVATLILGLRLKGREGYYKVPLITGTVLLVYPTYIALKSIVAPNALLYILIAFLISSSAAVVLIYYLDVEEFKKPWVYSIFIAHFLDASATFVGVDYFGFWEEHVFENFLISKVGTALILFPFKLLVLIIVIAALQKLVEKEALNFWYFAMFILGLAPGIRDALTIMLLG
ncbi:MAG: DUF63 family protein [Candidatus Hydrothermarchaeales archaeon]